jgi:transcriptional regulator with XRE-family HTH domain
MGRRLETLRRQFSCTPIEMARKLGLSRSGYFKNETGNNFPSLKTLNILANEFDISMDWFIFNKGPTHYKTKLREGELEIEQERLKKEALELQKEKEDLEKKKEELSRFTALAEVTPDINELLEHMAGDSQLRYKVLLNFYEYKKENARPEQSPA